MSSASPPRRANEMDYAALILDHICSGCRFLRIDFDAYSGDLDRLADAIGRSSTISKLEVAGSTLSLEYNSCLARCLSKNTSIQSIEIRDCRLKSCGASDLERSLAECEAPLRRLVLWACRDMDKTWYSISAAALSRPGLQIAQVQHSSWDGCPVLAAASTSTSLRMLTLDPESRSRLGNTATFIQSLGVNTSLTSLDTSCCGAEGAASLQPMLEANSTICSLSLGESTASDTGTCDVTTAVGRALRTNERLLDLNVGGVVKTRTGTRALGEALATNSSLRSLVASGYSVTPADVKLLADGIREGACNGTLRLELLCLNRDFDCDEFFATLGEAIASPKGCSLRKLRFDNQGISHVGLSNLFSSRPTKGAGIQELGFLDYDVSYKGAEAIADHLASPWCIMSELELPHCQLCDSGVTALGRALAVNTTLKRVDLPMSGITSEGGQAIGLGLQTNSTLEELSLPSYDGYMDASCAATIGKALGDNPATALRRLEFSLYSDGLSAIASGLAGNTTLRDLDICTSYSADPASLQYLLRAATDHPTLQELRVVSESSTGEDAMTDASDPALQMLLRDSASIKEVVLYGIAFVQADVEGLSSALASCNPCTRLCLHGFADCSTSATQALYDAAMLSGSMCELSLPGTDLKEAAAMQERLGLRRHAVVGEWMDQQLKTEDSAQLSSVASSADVSMRPRYLAARAVAAMRLAAEGGAVDLAQVAVFVGSCMDTIQGSMARPSGEGGRDPATMAMVSLVLGMGDACKAEYDEVERDYFGVPVMDELPGLQAALRLGGCFDRVRSVRRWAIGIEYRGLAGLCDEALFGEAAVRKRQLLRWRRAVEARRDASMVFQAASYGRPLELGKRLRLGRLAGGLWIEGEVEGGAVLGPLEAARLGGHEECVRVLEEAIEGS